jgi:hypothetical protein
MLKLNRGSADVLAKIVDGEITVEEKAYEMYDLDKLFGVSSYSKIKKNLSGLFKTFDSEFNESLYDELCLLVKEEEKIREQNKVSKEESEAIDKDAEDVPWDDTKKEETQTEVRKTREPSTQTTQSVDITTLPFWSDLSDNDRVELNKEVAEYVGGELKFKSETILLPCTACNKPLPNTVFRCPYCGTEL